MLLLLLLGACDSADLTLDSASVERPDTPWSNVKPTRRTAGSGPVLTSATTGPIFKGGVYEGTGQLIGNEPASPYSRAPTKNDPNGITLNILNASIEEAAKTILGDILKVNYIVDGRVTGTITLQTTNPISVTSILDIFETTLRLNAAALIKDDSGIYKVIPAQEATNALPELRVAANSGQNQQIGVALQIVPLNYVSAVEMERILQPIAPQGSIVRVDDARNLLFLRGSRPELAYLLETVSIFDVDWMQGMSFALFPLQTSEPEAVSAELETIFSTGQAGVASGTVRFLPNKRLRSILVISANRNLLKKAETWIKRLDAAASGAEQQLFVYRVQNRPALEVADVIQELFSGKSGSTIPRGRAAAPKFEEAEANTDATGGPYIPAQEPVGATAFGASASALGERVRVVADEANNALLIYAAAADYQRVAKVLERLDVLPNQVLIEATIAEVSLNDELKFGLKWFFESGNSNFTLTSLANGAVQSAFPGFSYLFASNSVRVVLDALASITDVNVISSPTLMVMDNRTAVLQVGDQVPIVTQTARDVGSTTAPIVNSVSLKDTGVILRVSPRVNESGRVVLDIEQEVSDVVQTTTSGIDSPTIQQRKIQTTVVVSDGESIALGGLIQQSATLRRGQVPVLGDAPIIGNLFKSKTDKKERTELLILITPHVVRDVQEARHVTDEFRKQLGRVVPKVRPEKNDLNGKLRRLLQ